MLFVRAKDGVRLLGNGELKSGVNFEVTGASKGAIAAVEKAGGSVKLVEMPKIAAKEREKADWRLEKREQECQKRLVRI